MAVQALVPAAKFLAPILLPYLMEKIGSNWATKAAAGKTISKYDKAGKLLSTTNIPGKVPTAAKLLQGAGSIGLNALAVLGPTILSGLSAGARATGDTAGAAVNAVANAPAALLSGMASDQQQSVYGPSILQPAANIVSLAGNVGQVAAQGAGETIGTALDTMNTGIQARINQKNMLDYIQKQSSMMASSPLSSAQYDILGRAMSNLPLNKMRNPLGSDEEIKEVFTPERVQELLALIGKDRDFDSEDAIDDEVLKGYAEHIHNYLYTYNQEALKVDPTTDTQQEHIGPMAQDLEKVNPATVVEDPKSGYKTVDTGRLALMNAGAIAELARRMEDLENVR